MTFERLNNIMLWAILILCMTLVFNINSTTRWYSHVEAAIELPCYKYIRVSRKDASTLDLEGSVDKINWIHISEIKLEN